MGYNLTLAGIDGEWKFNVDVTVIDSDYTASENDYFIGAQIEDQTTLTLPETPTPGTILVIKLMNSRWGIDKILTITTSDESLIDSETSIVMTRPHQTIQLLFHGDRWNIISRYG